MTYWNTLLKGYILLSKGELYLAQKNCMLFVPQGHKIMLQKR